jgi:hypothetical protein
MDKKTGSRGRYLMQTEKKIGPRFGVFIMSHLVLPNGFELVTFFSWDHLPASLRGASRAVATQASLPITGHLSTVTHPVDRFAAEEDAERWDGLS